MYIHGNNSCFEKPMSHWFRRVLCRVFRSRIYICVHAVWMQWQIVSIEKRLRETLHMTRTTRQRFDDVFIYFATTVAVVNRLCLDFKTVTKENWPIEIIMIYSDLSPHIVLHMDANWISEFALHCTFSNHPKCVRIENNYSYRRTFNVSVTTLPMHNKTNIYIGIHNIINYTLWITFAGIYVFAMSAVCCITRSRHPVFTYSRTHTHMYI